jgi:uncharacterized membrane protein
MRRLHSYLLILIALWLPLQAAAAWAMPFCRHAAAEQAAQATEHCHAQAAAAAQPAAATDLDCDNCEMCHLASAGYLLAAADAGVFGAAASVQVPRLKPASPSHIAEPPQQPPRRSN